MKSYRQHRFKQCTLLLIDLHAHVDVDSQNDQVADDVERSHSHEHVRIVERYLLARLHHHKDDNEVGAARSAWLAFLRDNTDRDRGHTFADSWLW